MRRWSRLVVAALALGWHEAAARHRAATDAPPELVIHSESGPRDGADSPRLGLASRYNMKDAWGNSGGSDHTSDVDAFHRRLNAAAAEELAANAAQPKPTKRAAKRTAKRTAKRSAKRSK
jgi:hypothetical protein